MKTTILLNKNINSKLEEESPLKESEKRPVFPRLKAWQAGFIVGLSAALIQAVYNIMPKTVEGVKAYSIGPVAYGFCMFCHVRDFVNWFLKGSIPWLKVAPISAVVPVLSVVGVLVGGSLTAIAAKDFSFRKTTNPVSSFIYGVLVVFFAAVLGACPWRLSLRVAYFGVVAFVGWIFLILGVLVATKFILKRGGG